MNAFKISARLYALVGIALATMLGTGIFAIFQEHAALVEQRRAMLAAMNDNAVHVFDAYHKRELAGEMSREEAQKLSMDAIRPMRYEPDGYFFITDMNENMLMHPLDARLDGSNQAGLKATRQMVNMIADQNRVDGPEINAEVEIIEALELRPRVRRDRETFGWTAPLLFAQGDIAHRVGRWEFERNGRAEGWLARKSVTLSVDAGALAVQLQGSDPGMLSPEQLGLPTSQYGTLRLGVRNVAVDGQLQVFFTTTDEPVFSAERELVAPLPPAGGAQAEVVVDLASHPLWSGTLAQLRIDPYDGNVPGQIVFDYIRLEP